MTLHNVLTPLEDRTRTQQNPNTQYATRERPRHWGTDLRPTAFNTAGDPVHAPAPARVVAVGYGKGNRSAPIPWHSGRFVMLDLGVWGGDQMYVYLGHLASTRVEPGQRIGAGHIIGTMGGSGTRGERHFKVHLHLGVSVNAPRPTGKFRAGRGWTDPVAWFARHAVDLNTTPTALQENIMTPEQEAKLDRALSLLDGLPKDVWAHEFAHPRTGAQTPARAFLASDYANGQAIHAMVSAIAEKSGIDGPEVERIIRDAIEKGLAAGVDLEATLKVKEK